MSEKIIIPDGQTTKWVLNNYYQQPSGSAISEAQSIHYRNYFNTLFRNEVAWNNNYNAQLYRHLFGDNVRKYSQPLRSGGSMYLRALSNALSTVLAFTDAVSIKVYGVDDNFISTLDYNVITYMNNLSYETTYYPITLTSDPEDGKLCLYFNGSISVYSQSFVNSVSFLGNLPETISIGDTCTISNPDNGAASIQVFDIVYLETENVMALKFNVAYVYTSDNSGTLKHYYERSSFNTFMLDWLMSDLPLDTCFYLKLSALNTKTGDTIAVWESEYYYRSLDLPNTLKFNWGENEMKIGLLEYQSYDYMNFPIITNFMFLPCEMYALSPSQSTSELFNDEQGSSRLISSIYTRIYKLKIDEPVPRYIIDTLAIAFRHRYFYINNKRYVADLSTFEATKIESSMMFTAECELREYEITGIYDTEGYDFEHIEESPYKLLKIDADNYLKIDPDGHKLRIK